jgi:hypothetical protein
MEVNYPKNRILQQSELGEQGRGWDEWDLCGKWDEWRIGVMEYWVTPDSAQIRWFPHGGKCPGVSISLSYECYTINHACRRA